MADAAEVKRVAAAIRELENPSDLDGLVCDMKDAEARALNDAGLAAQVEYLLDQGLTEDRIVNEARGEIGG